MASNDGTLTGPSEPVNGEDTAPELADPGQEAGSSLLVFPVAGYGVIYDHELPTEYIDDQAIFPIPTDHPLFRGLINRRGSLVPIYEIRSLVDSGRHAPDDTKNHLFILGRGDDAVGILLDTTPYRKTVTEGQKVPPPSVLTQVFGEHIKHCYKDGDDFYVNVALDAFLYELRNGAVQS